MNGLALVDREVVGRGYLRSVRMFEISCLIRRWTGDRWWLSSIVFCALTEQRRNRVDTKGLAHLASGFRASLRELDRSYEKSAFELEG